jgi:hypothetical protein
MARSRQVISEPWIKTQREQGFRDGRERLGETTSGQDLRLRAGIDFASGRP